MESAVGRLGTELRRLRESTRQNIAQVAAELAWSSSKLSRIETGRSGVSAEDLGQLLDRYGVNAAERSHLALLSQPSSGRSWLKGYREMLRPNYEEYLHLESTAQSIWLYETTAVHGLLQTAEYAAAINKPFAFFRSSNQLSSYVAIQLARQAILSRDPLLDVTIILDEAVLRRQVGDLGVMRRQMSRLLEVSGQPSVTIRILPFEVGAHAGISGSFAYLNHLKDNHPDSSAIFFDSLAGGAFLRSASDLRLYKGVIDQMSEVTASSDESMGLISSAIRSYAG